ncbi:Sensory transduction protein regX3 [uncultured Roseburia sp.]|uniref:Stage 0 sporulation protein A homolog n=1 Tax=Brotonthovivens ammoniilytica TaxID=2981725 RepID=A0ABT2TMM2_9FIRM|nr:response regulator transcription factor [Brotonthovivens ammoniilytica]MCU6763474.1 response regulator transcription factor [Brotonthovivens ammoniilytica]SCJ20571.1 Sensory transduction protein regX3 [uncultured Roseburia sp.]
MTRILLVEDDKWIIKSLTEFLKEEGFELFTACGQKEALDRLKEREYDLALLDVSLQDGNGFSVCSAIKKEMDLPVIFLTASDDEYSVVTGLDLGADDYISKPFRPRELVSRIRSVLRRTGKKRSVICMGALRIDPEKGSVLKNGREISLSALEYRLLLLFAGNQGMILSRSRILEEIWDVSGEFVNDNTLTVYIKRLREKVEDDPQNPEMIKTVRGLGYRIGE